MPCFPVLRWLLKHTLCPSEGSVGRQGSSLALPSVPVSQEGSRKHGSLQPRVPRVRRSRCQRGPEGSELVKHKPTHANSSEKKKGKFILAVKKCFLRPTGRNNVWPLRGQMQEAGRPQDCLSLSHSSTLFAYSLFFSAPQSTQWENGSPQPQGPLITDGATCKDRSDLLPSQL